MIFSYDVINDGENRRCTFCGEDSFFYDHTAIIKCNNCYERYNPIPHMHELFMEISK